MIDKYTSKLDNEGVSPVIGVILLVAVTVALVALATVIVFDIGSDVGDTADATTQVEFEDGLAKATVIRNENVDEFIMRNVDTGFEDTVTGVGQTAEIGVEDGDNIVVIAVLDSGEEEVLISRTAENVGVIETSSQLTSSEDLTVDLEGEDVTQSLLIGEFEGEDVDSAGFTFTQQQGDSFVYDTDGNNYDEAVTLGSGSDTINNQVFVFDAEDNPNSTEDEEVIGTRFTVSEVGEHEIQITLRDDQGRTLDTDTVTITVNDSG